MPSGTDERCWVAGWHILDCKCQSRAERPPSRLSPDERAWGELTQALHEVRDELRQLRKAITDADGA